jgi:1-acyl-sn-glycerol-3-phosphate acyltransferase
MREIVIGTTARGDGRLTLEVRVPLELFARSRTRLERAGAAAHLPAMETDTLRAPRVDEPADDFRPWFYLAFGSAMRAGASVWHRYEMRGMEKIPSGPCLFVGNHGGTGTSDVLCMLGAWRARFGLRRRVVGMMHDINLALPIMGWCAKSFGATRANPAAARHALGRGYDVVCFPGGDMDSCRPFTAPREVRFGDRRGYARLAIETGVPVVPLATLGSHASYLVLPGSDRVAAVARRLGLRSRAFPVTLGSLGVLVAIALAVVGAVSPWWIAVALIAALVPTPVRITTDALAPIDVCTLTAHVTDPKERVELAHRLVHGALSDALRSMRHSP